MERGDVWTVGRHRPVCGDATSAEDVAKLMEGRKANLIVTDPPYGVSFKSSSGLTIQNDSMKDEEFYNFLPVSYTHLDVYKRQVTAPNADTQDRIASAIPVIRPSTMARIMTEAEFLSLIHI